MDEKIIDITLLLMYMTGWEETLRNSNPNDSIFRTYSGYPREVLDILESQKMLYRIPSGKTIVLTQAGKKRAEEVKQMLS